MTEGKVTTHQSFTGMARAALTFEERYTELLASVQDTDVREKIPFPAAFNYEEIQKLVGPQDKLYGGHSVVRVMKLIQYDLIKTLCLVSEGLRDCELLMELSNKPVAFYKRK